MSDIWELSNSSRAKVLEAQFRELGVDSSTPGFCDSPAFLRAERRNARVMDLYAEFIETRSYEAKYLAEARKKIEIVAETVRDAIEKDGRPGACVHASGIIGRMLDKLGIWNYVAKSTLTITYPASAGITPNYFWALDTGDFDSPHAIVVAPPFAIIDVTLRYQQYGGGETKYIPHSVLADKYSSTEWNGADLASDNLRAYLRSRGSDVASFLRANRPHVLQTIASLPPRQVSHEATRMKYVIVAVGGFIEQLDDIVGYNPNGRTAREIFDQDVMPLIETEGKK
jgi:hypothetical protein